MSNEGQKSSIIGVTKVSQCKYSLLVMWVFIKGRPQAWFKKIKEVTFLRISRCLELRISPPPMTVLHSEEI